VTGWPLVPLGSLCNVLGGGTPPRNMANYFGGPIPWATPTDVTSLKRLEIFKTRDTLTEEGLRRSSARLLPPGTVLLTSRATLGYAAINQVPMCTNQGFANFVCGPQLLPEFLALWLPTQRAQMERMAGHTTFKEVSKANLKRLEIPLPPLDEQRRIVDILNRANGIRRLRREALDKARQLIPALFVDMFGDPATNLKGWPIRTLGELGELDRGRSRHRPRNDPRLLGGPYPFIQTGDVANSGGQITTYSTTYSDFGLAQSRMWPRGTLCITIAANIASTGVLTFDACFPDSVVGFQRGAEVSSFYIQSTLDRLQGRLERLAPQLAQKNINLRILRSVEVPVPPLQLQEEFAERTADTQSAVAQQERMLEASDQLVASLMAQLFDGSVSTTRAVA
jgi:type I restriction enzyme, S subunit